MKTFKQFNKDEDVKDFEEDLVAVKPKDDEKEEINKEEKEWKLLKHTLKKEWTEESMALVM